MKITLALFAILAFIGLGQSHQFPDFGYGPLHEDFQDFLDLVPVKKIVQVAAYYAKHDSEVQAAINFLTTTPTLKNLVIDFESIPEVTEFINGLYGQNIDIYNILNQINRALEINELIPPWVPSPIPGLFRDVKRLFNYDAFISVYVDKLKNSTPFVDLVNEIKSENFQVLVNKIFESQSVQIIQNGLKDKVNLKIVGDIFYLLFGITFPDHVKSLEEHFVDFFYLLPAQEMVDIVVKYLNEDKEVQNAVQFVTTSEFHDLLRATEALKEHQEFVLYLQNHGLNIIEQIKELHKAIGMEDYVPPKIENFLKAQIKTQEVGGGVKALLDDLYSLLPFEKIDALYEEKISKSKIFKDFYDAITSEEFVNLANNLAAQEPVKQLVAKSNEKGLDLAGFQRFGSRIIGFK
ncbi:Protein G12 [Camponotus floridanus]|uniref:Protein G12 n=1 Tax=Camponotus floridanus TaxID=104421 RepID=E2A6E1_CAMFO|nr:Protein G12 [Camponotus floridanus]